MDIQHFEIVLMFLLLDRPATLRRPVIVQPTHVVLNDDGGCPILFSSLLTHAVNLKKFLVRNISPLCTDSFIAFLTTMSIFKFARYTLRSGSRNKGGKYAHSHLRTCVQFGVQKTSKSSIFSVLSDHMTS